MKSEVEREIILVLEKIIEIKRDHNQQLEILVGRLEALVDAKAGRKQFLGTARMIRNQMKREGLL